MHICVNANQGVLWEWNKQDGLAHEFLHRKLQNFLIVISNYIIFDSRKFAYRFLEYITSDTVSLQPKICETNFINIVT